MQEQNSTTQVAPEYYKALRAEIVARYQMRDQIMIAYLGATGTLLSFALQKLQSGDQRLVQSLLVLLPFLSLGALSMIAQHQEQVTAYYQYFVIELRQFLPEPERDIAMFYMSKAAQQHTHHILRMLFIPQLLIMCGPPILAVFLSLPYFAKGWSIKESLLAVGVIFTCLTAFRVWSSMHYRTAVMNILSSINAVEYVPKRHRRSYCG
jgi:hypothetical protein